MRVAYFVNLYPAVSHTFIRREIRALEAHGISVSRFAVRRTGDLPDDDDKAEAKQTRYILESSHGEMFKCCLKALVGRPWSFLSMIGCAIALGWKSEVGLIRHFAYAVEAAILAEWCGRARIQHIHAHFGTNPATVALLTGRLCAIPFSFTTHGPDEFEKAPFLSLDRKLELAKFVVCVSSFGRSQYMRWTSPERWHKISVIHCGLDSSFFQTPVFAPPSSPRLVCVGRLDERKAQILLVAAARRLRDQGVHCEIVIAGDGPMRSQIERAINEANLQKVIRITGWLSGKEVKAELLAARALVLPSFAENMPVVIMEAFALGRPVLSTYIAGIPELVQADKTGWLVPAGDEIALAKAMQDVLLAPIDRLASMAEAGRRRIVEEHDASVEAGYLKSLMEDCPAVAIADRTVRDEATENIAIQAPVTTA